MAALKVLRIKTLRRSATGSLNKASDPFLSLTHSRRHFLPEAANTIAPVAGDTACGSRSLYFPGSRACVFPYFLQLILFNDLDQKSIRFISSNPKNHCSGPYFAVE